MKRSIQIAAAATLLLGSLQASPSIADDSGSAEIVNLVDVEIPVLSNGSDYHLLPPATAVRAYVRVKLDTGTAGRIKWYTTWLSLVTGVPTYPDWHNYREDGHHQSYDPRPKTIDETVLVGIPGVSFKSRVIEQCNKLADRLRGQGLGNTAIFSQDRKIELGVAAGNDWEASGPDGNPIVEGDSHYKTIKIVCRKWDGLAIPQVTDQLDSVPPVVKKASLTLLERSGLSGVCKVILSGVIETSVPNTKVRFRYKDDAGHQSEVHKVKTDHTGTVMFDHEYDVPNNPDGGERGKVRIVGVSHPFESKKQAYDMDCTAPATNDFQALLPPTLQMQVIPQEKVMVGQQLCVSRVKIVGKIVGRGPMSGYAAFVGDHNYISPPQAYEVEQGDIVLMGADREIDWTPDPQGTYTTGPAPAGQPKKKTIDIGFNVTGSNNAIVASLPKRGFTFTCSFPTLNPAVIGGQGLTVEPRQPAAPSAPRRLQQREGSGQPALQVQPKLRLPRKQ
jgi:hypothetical protein